MGLFDSKYLREYNSLMQKIDDLNEQNVRGYDTFKEYVLSDEIMMSYFRQLKKLERKYSKLHVDSFETFQKIIYEQLDDIYHKKLKEIKNIKDKEERKQKMIELKQNIEDSYGHCCDPQLNIILNDINTIFNCNENTKINKTQNEKAEDVLSDNSQRKLNYFNEEYNTYMKSCSFHISEAIECLNNNACINCGCVLDKQIKGNMKCPNCSNKIYVRTDMYSKKKLALSDKTIKDFEQYDKKIREILFFERIMKKKEFVYNEYMTEFKSIKNKSVNVRDIMWQFANKVGSDLDNSGYRIFMIASRKNKNDRVLENFSAIRFLKLAIQEYVTMYEIANYENKTEIALNLLTQIAYRDVQVVELDKEGDSFREFTIDDYISQIHSSLIVEFLDKNDYTIDDFKNIFLETKHPFILSRLSNNETWNYIEEALERQIKWNNQNK